MPKPRKEIKDIREAVQKRGKKFCSYQEGAELYSLGLHSFQKIAKEAGAIYKVGGRVLVNVEIIDEFMEVFHEF